MSNASSRAKRLSVTVESRVGSIPGAPGSSFSRRGTGLAGAPPVVSRASSFQVPRTEPTSLARRPGAPLASSSFQGVPRSGASNYSSLTSTHCESSFEVEGVKGRYAVLTQGGCDPGGHAKVNQDSFVVQERLLGFNTTALFAVCDGHGQFGQKVSQHLVQSLPLSIGHSPAFRSGDLEEACRSSFPEVNRCLISRRDINCEMSGSTCCLALVHKGKKLLIANVGDSRAILGSVDSRGAISARDLNIEHKPAVASEASRIVSRGGRIEPYVFQGQHVGPPRVWLRTEDAPGLCMTRAFGDQLAATVGVICEPEFTSFTLKSTDKYLILCSDGITEFFSSTDIVRLIHNAVGPRFGPREAAQAILSEARRRWSREEEDVVDDCTVIVIFLSVS